MRRTGSHGRDGVSPDVQWDRHPNGEAQQDCRSTRHTGNWHRALRSEATGQPGHSEAVKLDAVSVSHHLLPVPLPLLEQVGPHCCRRTEWRLPWECGKGRDCPSETLLYPGALRGQALFLPHCQEVAGCLEPSGNKCLTQVYSKDRRTMVTAPHSRCSRPAPFSTSVWTFYRLAP